MEPHITKNVIYIVSSQIIIMVFQSFMVILVLVLVLYFVEPYINSNVALKCLSILVTVNMHE